MEFEKLTYIIEDGVGIITLNSPKKVLVSLLKREELILRVNNILRDNMIINDINR